MFFMTWVWSFVPTRGESQDWIPVACVYLLRLRNSSHVRFCLTVFTRYLHIGPTSWVSLQGSVLLTCLGRVWFTVASYSSKGDRLLPSCFPTSLLPLYLWLKNYMCRINPFYLLNPGSQFILLFYVHNFFFRPLQGREWHGNTLFFPWRKRLFSWRKRLVWVRVGSSTLLESLTSYPTQNQRWTR